MQRKSFMLNLDSTEPAFRMGDGGYGGLKGPKSERQPISRTFTTYLKD